MHWSTQNNWINKKMFLALSSLPLPLTLSLKAVLQSVHFYAVLSQSRYQAILSSWSCDDSDSVVALMNYWKRFNSMKMSFAAQERWTDLVSTTMIASWWFQMKMEMLVMVMLRKIKNIPAISRSWILEESPRGDLWDQRCTENHNDHTAMITVQPNDHTVQWLQCNIHFVHTVLSANHTIQYWTPAEFLFQLTWLSHCLLCTRIKAYRSHL